MLGAFCKFCDDEKCIGGAPPLVDEATAVQPGRFRRSFSAPTGRKAKAVFQVLDRAAGAWVVRHTGFVIAQYN